MLVSRLALAVSCCLALAAPCAEDVPALRLAVGTTLVRTLHTKSELALDEVHLVLNGEEVEGDFLEALDMRMQHEETQVVRDTFEAVADDRPTRVQRTFEELSGSEHTRFTSEEGEEQDDGELESALETKSVLFSWSEERGTYAATLAAGQEGDAELLSGLTQDMDLTAFLPPHAVAAGDAWELEPRAFEAILEPGGDVCLLDPEAEEEQQQADDDEADQELLDNLSGSIRATYKGVREEQGVRAAVIELAIDVRTRTERPLQDDSAPPGSSGTDRAEPSFTLAGELRWDLEHGHALTLELEGESQLTLTQTLVGDMEGERIEQSQSMSFSGPYSFTLAVERR